MTSYDSVPDFGLLYDSIPVYQAREDVAFFVDEARAERNVLEIGCGTGRILLPIARSGVTITGLDVSAAMLSRCGDKVEAEPAEVRRRVSLTAGDVRDFSFADRFTLALAPFRVLQHLLTHADQLRCLEAVRRSLEPGGRFIFDVFNPRFDLLLQDRSAETEETPELMLPDGRFLRRSFRILQVRWLEQVADVELIYYVRRGDAVERIVQAFPMRWYLKSELEHLIARAGFTLEAMHGGFDRRPLADDAPEFIVVARKATRAGG
jgi:SAM-dependent methyltransferase